MIPNKWRMVRHTDDGCNIYQCLRCKGQWESRSAPGWFNRYVTTECLVEGGFTVLEGEERTPRHTAKRAEPVYMAEWLFCPVCGVRWEGPLRDNEDNERMLGERRKRLDQLMYHHGGYNRREPDYWYVITELNEYRSSLSGREMRDLNCKINPACGLLKAFDLLRRMRETWDEDPYEDEDRTPGREMYQMTIMKTKELKRYAYVREGYP